MQDHKISCVKVSAFDGMKPGTSGLRKTTKTFMTGNYTETFVQCVLTAGLASKLQGCTLVVGGDGRFYNDKALQKIIQICAANKVSKLYVAQNGIMSTPAVSCCIRKFKADGGIILTASHNPGGEEHDFGIKFNIANGGPAPEHLTSKMYELSRVITQYLTCPLLQVNVAKVAITKLKVESSEFVVEVVDSVGDYLEMVKDIFDLPSIRALIQSGFKVTADAMHGVMGPYITRVLCEELGVASADVRNCLPSADFNKGHPDPNLTHAKDLVNLMQQGVFHFGAAFDGDGDRNMVLGHNGFFVNPSDSLAVIAANLHCIPYFQKKPPKGFARSMPTSSALDRVAEKASQNMYITPTGWKFFGNLMDSSLISLCGEESFGIGSDHIREKDGMWAVLAWLSILTNKKQSVEEIVKSHWKLYGRNFYTRYDYEGVDSQKADRVMKELEALITQKDFSGRSLAASGKSYVVKRGDNFAYKDPVDSSESRNQGLIITFTDNSRIIFRLSGTGVTGATIRMYVDSYQADPQKVHLDPQTQLHALVLIGQDISRLQELTARTKADVIT